MPNHLRMLTINMLSFVHGGYDSGPFLRHVSISLAIGLTFGIFKSNNGEVSWSM
jgi:hypothetical protein